MTDLEKKLEQIIQSRAERGLLRKLSLENNLCDFSSNDYLGLARNSEVRNLFISSLSTLKNSSESVSGSGGLALLGSTGSRLLNGNSRAALALEDFLASYHRAPSALLVNSGYDGNLSFFGYVPQHKDAILYDELIHASVHDGVKISRAQFIHQFKHNNVEDLKRLCKQFNDQIKNREDQGNIFVAVETVYSMDGDLAPLKDLVDCAKEFSNVYIIVDEAHATGTFGEQGRGLVCDLGLEKYIFARLHTFGKAMGNHGAVILGSTILRDYLINYARPIIYSTFLSHHSLIGIRCAYEILSQNYVQLQTRLNLLISHFRNSCSLPSSILLNSNSSIQGIIVPGNSNTNKLAQYLRDHGFDVRPIRSPTVPKGLERVRICIHYHNTVKEIDSLCSEILRGLATLSKL